MDSCGTREGLGTLLAFRGPRSGSRPKVSIRTQVRIAKKTGKLHAEDTQLKGPVPKAFQRKLKHVEEVWLQNNRLDSFSFTDEPCWEEAKLIFLANNEFSMLPPIVVSGWRCLEEVSLSENPKLSELPTEAEGWGSLKQLYLDKLPLLKSLPSCRNWINLKVLHVNGSGLTQLPDDVSCLVNLTSVSLNDNALTSLPAGIGNWKCVVKLFLNNNQLTALPEEIGDMKSLEKLYVSNNQLSEVPETLGSIESLQELYLTKNSQLSKLPDSVFSKCNALNKLYLNDCCMQSLNMSLPAALEILHLGNNPSLVALSATIGGNVNLKFIHLNNTAIVHLDPRLAELPQLRTFDVEGCPLDEESAQLAKTIQGKLIKAWTFSTTSG